MRFIRNLYRIQSHLKKKKKKNIFRRMTEKNMGFQNLCVIYRRNQQKSKTMLLYTLYIISYLGHDDLSLSGFLDIVTMVLVSIIHLVVFFSLPLYTLPNQCNGLEWWMD